MSCDTIRVVRVLCALVLVSCHATLSDEGEQASPVREEFPLVVQDVFGVSGRGVAVTFSAPSFVQGTSLRRADGESWQLLQEVRDEAAEGVLVQARFGELRPGDRVTIR